MLLLCDLGQWLGLSVPVSCLQMRLAMASHTGLWGAEGCCLWGRMEPDPLGVPGNQWGGLSRH